MHTHVYTHTKTKIALMNAYHMPSTVLDSKNIINIVHKSFHICRPSTATEKTVTKITSPQLIAIYPMPNASVFCIVPAKLGLILTIPNASVSNL